MRIVFWLAIAALVSSLAIRGCKKIDAAKTPAPIAAEAAPLEAAAPVEPQRDEEKERLQARLNDLEQLIRTAQDTQAEEQEREAERERLLQEAQRKADEERKKAEAGFVTHVFVNREIPTKEEVGEVLPGEFFADQSTNQIIVAVKTADEMVDVADLLQGLDKAPNETLYRIDAVIVTAELLDAEAFSLEWLAKWGNVKQPWKAEGSVSPTVVEMRSDWFDFALEKARSEGRLAITSRPHLVLSRGEAATVSSGRDVPLPRLNVSDGNAQTGIEYRKIALETSVALEEVGSDRIAVDVKQIAAQVAGSVVIGDSEVPEVASQEWTTRILPQLGAWYAVGGVAMERSETGKGWGLIATRRKSATRQRQEFGMFVRVTRATSEPPTIPQLRAEPILRATPAKSPFWKKRGPNHK